MANVTTTKVCGICGRSRKSCGCGAVLAKWDASWASLDASWAALIAPFPLTAPERNASGGGSH